MKQELITALAREYAEEIYPHEEGEDLGQMEFLRNNATKHISYTLKMLLRRYCLVEKNVIKETWEAIANLYLAEKHIDYNGARYLFNEVLFPDLGKEVE